MTIQYVTGNTFPHRETLKAQGWAWARPDDRDASGKYVHQGRWVRASVGRYDELSPLGLDYDYDEATAYELRVLAGETQASPAVPPAPAVVDQDGNAADDATFLTEDEMRTWSDQALNFAKRWLAANVADQEHPRFDTGKLKKDEKTARLWECYCSGDLRAAYAAWQAEQETPKAPVAAVRGGGAVAPAPIAEDSDVARRLRELFEAAGLQGPAAAAAPVDTETVRGIVAEMIADLTRPTRLEVVRAGEAPVVVDGAHPRLSTVLRLVAQGLNVLMVGPAGCGKTHIASQVGQALKARRVTTLSLTAGTSEAALVGRLLPVRAGGTFAYLPSPVIDVFENGGVILLDEVDAADANMLLIANTMTANGHIEVEQRLAGDADGNAIGTLVMRHPECVILAAANTYGNGADAMYVGRGQLDAAFLDRFLIVTMDYDPTYEATLVAGRGTAYESLLSWVHSLRALVVAKKARRVVSTRMIQKGVKALDAGFPLAEVREMLTAGWSTDDLRMATEAR